MMVSREADVADVADVATWRRASNVWIMKPVSSSRGRGIFLVNDISEVECATLPANECKYKLCL